MTQASSVTTLIDFASKFMMPFVLCLAGWLYTEVGKLDQRVYNLQREAVTEQKLAEVEKRLTTYMEVRIGDLSVKQDMTNKYLEMLLQSKQIQKE